ncbi:MAG: aminotransferase class I/II-fold pyridoxal phosphate-dependent enzyme, partial [Propioniciclava sp.]
MPTFDDLDAITLEALRASGATRWNKPNGAIGAFTAEMDYGIAPAVTAALHAFVDTGLFGYLPPSLRTDLQQAQADFLARRLNWKIPAEQIHEVPDVLKALEMAMEHFANGAKRIIVPTPAYMPFVFLPQMFGYEVVEVPMLLDETGRYCYDLAGIEQAFNDGAGLLVHCHPHNPTGRLFTRAELEALAEVVDRCGGRVFSDEIWAPLVPAGRTHIPYAAVSEVTAGHTVTAMSASKAWNLPGLKCAQLITSNEADEAVWKQVGLL